MRQRLGRSFREHFRPISSTTCTNIRVSINLSSNWSSIRGSGVVGSETSAKILSSPSKRKARGELQLRTSIGRSFILVMVRATPGRKRLVSGVCAKKVKREPGGDL